MMSADPLRLDALLESVADGSDVDWDAAEAAADEGQRRIVRNLRLVASIANVHRTTSDEIPEAGTAALLHTAPAGRAIPRWGHLLLLETIGEGAFGEVYRARDPWLDRQVALKLLKPDIAGPERLVAEAQALARIRHPNVVTVHGADMHDGRVGLWMELVRGRTLAAIVASDGPFSAAEASVIGQDLCKAVAAVHAAGLVHHDIKAQNVMRESGGRPVLMDFGTGHTPLYAAPELARGGEPSGVTDIYALGVLLYYLVTGTYPVKGTSTQELLNAHANGLRQHLGDLRSDLSDQFVAVVERALSPDPAQRYATAREMQQALATTIAARPEAQRTPDAPTQGWSIRRAAMAIGIAASIALAAVGGWLSERRAVPARGASNPLTLAVLPLSGHAESEEYFADGMTEALIQELSVLDSLRVISRTSVMQFKGARQSAREIAATLHADVILEGSVTRSENEVRINVRLIHAGTDTPVWTRGFDRQLDSVIALQRDVAKAVAGDLPVVVTPAAAERWWTAQTVKPEAYDVYLRGLAALSEKTRDGMQRAVNLFSKALEVDARNAQAQAGIAIAHAQLAGTYNATSRANVDRARRAARAALALNPQTAEAHAVLGEMAFFSDWDWQGAEASYRRALALNPSLDFARERYGMFLAARRRIDEALTHIGEARRLDPLSVNVVVVHAGLLRYARRYSEAITRYREVLAKDPRHTVANIGLGRALIATGAFDEALEHYRRVLEREPGRTALAGEIAQAHAGAGRRAEALEIVRALEREVADGRPIEPETLAYVHARLANHDQAFDWLTRAFERRSPGVLWLAVDSRVDSLRSDARFGLLLRRLDLD
jgi:eukaryotic-like serine/threonine-protein kinase